MSYGPILALLTRMQRETAQQANTMALTVPGSSFADSGAGAGVGVRLKALSDVYAEVLTLGLREHEAAADGSSPATP